VTGDQYSNITFGDLLFADVVVISYNFLLNKIFNNTVYKRKLESDFSKRGFTLNREMTLEEKNKLLMSKDLVLLHLFYWNRVILDEVHEIQNMQKANVLKDKISNFSSIYKWNISGTPFANNVTSFVNLMSYNTDYGKAYYNFDIYKNECINLKNLVEFGLDSDIINKCKFLFRRNTKQSIKDEYDGSVIKPNVHFLNFTSQERSIYDSYIQESNRHLNFLIKLCCHPELNQDTKEMIRNCKTFDEIQKCMLDYNKQLLEKECNKIKILEIEIDYYEKELRDERDDSDTIDSIKCKLNISRRQYTISKKNREDISRTYNYLKMSIDKLKDSSSECVCPICLDDINVDNIVITKCGHKFCWDCLYETHKIRKDAGIKCPTCNLCMNNDEVYLLKDDKRNHNEMSDLEKIIDRVKSTKIGNIIYYLKNSIEPNDKVILFSQWDEMLHKVGDLLKDTGINIVYCNGTVYQRKRAITNFTKKDDVNVILLSSRNAASGINLTVSNKIIFLEPIYGTKDYRTSIESQAIGRADRIGQKRPIEIHRFLIKQTVEEEIYDDLIDDTKLKQLNMK
jgi:SNF2 family DNA or RNA helicase